MAHLVRCSPLYAAITVVNVDQKRQSCTLIGCSGEQTTAMWQLAQASGPNTSVSDDDSFYMFKEIGLSKQKNMNNDDCHK